MLSLMSWEVSTKRVILICQFDDIDADVQVNLPPMDTTTSMIGPTETSGDASVRPWSGRLRRNDDSSASTSNVVG